MFLSSSTVHGGRLVVDLSLDCLVTVKELAEFQSLETTQLGSWKKWDAHSGFHCKEAIGLIIIDIYLFIAQTHTKLQASHWNSQAHESKQT